MHFLPQNPGFIAATRYGNFDGIHYMGIAENGYGLFQQAFFPLFPIIINFIHKAFGLSFVDAGIFVTNGAFFLLIYFMQKFLLLQYKNKTIIWIVLMFLSMPMAFFMQAIYTESLFILLVVISLLFFKRKKYFFAFLLCGLASATRLNGVFLTVIFLASLLFSNKNFKPNQMFQLVGYGLLGISGLVFYMIYLHVTFNDPLLFFHAQAAFGANRTTDTIILLPQVFFRYLKIFLTVDTSTLTFWVSVTEFISFNIVTLVSLVALKKRKNIEIALFSLISILTPTLTGTLSSIPRYSLSSIILPMSIQSIVKNKIFLGGIVLVLTIIQFIFAAAFFAGYFVS